jgi:hypothetical protein
MRLGRSDHRVERVRMRMRVAEHRYDHARTLARRVGRRVLRHDNNEDGPRP